MRIVHISTSDGGGAGKAAIRLHQGLLDAGFESDFLCLDKHSKNIPRVHQFKKKPESRILLAARIFGLSKTVEQKNQELLKNKGTNYEAFSFPLSSYDLLHNDLVKNADIIHFHWVSNFLDWPSFFSRNTKPIVWTLHDMNAFQGGFHYLNDHRNNQQEFKMLEEYIMNIKTNALAGKPAINVVCVSDWLLKESQASSLFGKYPHRLIRYSVPLDVYKLYDKNFCRQVLGLPADKKLVLFIAEAINNKRKGFAILQEAIENFTDDDVVFVTVGRINEAQLGAKKNIINLGYITEDRLLALAYAAADVFVIPSLEDNLPNTVLESLCCGTPVVGFKIGGVQEMVTAELQNGLLAESISSSDLKDTLKKALTLSFDSRHISGKAAEMYYYTVQVNKYADLYRSLI